MRRETKVFLILLAVNILLHIPVIAAGHNALLNWYLTDDAFYYFKTAQNISETGFISYDGLATTNGFHPLWMLICIPVFALARFDLYLPLRVLILVQVLLNATSGYLLYRLFDRHINTATAWLVAAAWMFLPPIHGITTKLGLETGLNTLALIWLIYAVTNFRLQDQQHSELATRQILYISLIAIVALFSRLDNIFLVLIFGVWLVFRHGRIRWISLLDLLILFFSAVSSYFLRLQSTENLFIFLPFAYILIALAMVIKPICLYFFGLYASLENQPFKWVVKNTILSMSLSSGLIAIVLFLLHDVYGKINAFLRAVLLLDYVLSVLMILIFRIILKQRDDRLSPEFEDLSLNHNWSKWLGGAIPYFVPLIGALMGYMTINHMYAHSAMPVSGQIKRWWGTLPNTVYGQPKRMLAEVMGSLLNAHMDEGPFWLITKPIYQAADWLSDLFTLPGNYEGGPHPLMQVLVWGVLLAFVLVVLQSNSRMLSRYADRLNLLPLFFGCILQALSYQASGYVHVRSWYWVGSMLLIMISVGLVIGVLIERSQKSIHKKKMTEYACLLMSLLLVINFGYSMQKDFPLTRQVQTHYDVDEDMRFIETHTRPGDVIGLTGGGFLGYFMPDRTIVNLDGLINSAAYFELLKKNRVDVYHRQIGTDFIYGDVLTLLDSDPYRWTYTNHLRFIAQGPYFQLFEYCPTECQ